MLCHQLKHRVYSQLKQIKKLLVFLCGGCLKSHNLGITRCDIHISLWIPAVQTRCIRHSKLISTNLLIYLFRFW